MLPASTHCWIILTQMLTASVQCLIASRPIYHEGAPKTESRHDGDFVVIGGIGAWRNNNDKVGIITTPGLGVTK